MNDLLNLFIHFRTHLCILVNRGTHEEMKSSALDTCTTIYLFKQSEIIDCLCVCVCVCIIEICEILNEKLVKEYTLLYWNLQIHCIIVDDLSFIFIQMVLTILYVIHTFLI